MSAGLKYDAAAARLATISDWIDEHNAHRDWEVNLWSRVTKASEEAGEAQTELRAFLGENPRKPQMATDALLVEELLDTAVAALGAVEHLRGNQGTSLDLLLGKIERVWERAGLS